MRVRILKPPIGVSASTIHFEVGKVYDVPANLASYLVAERFAIFERRSETNPKRIPVVDRREKG